MCSLEQVFVEQAEPGAGGRRRWKPAAQLSQQSFDALGTPLVDVTFCVLDIETTGGSADDGEITELGAVLVRGGACVGSFQTLVNPGCAIPRTITLLTGITDNMVGPAPALDEVLASFDEFVRRADVIVGHNVRYDLSFLGAALDRAGRERWTARVVDTLPLSRRLVGDEVPNHRLGTLAERLRLAVQPRHRALDDARATAELLHRLLERAGRLGVTGLDDLLALPTATRHPQAAKLALTDRLPRLPGVYLFRDRNGEVLYVGKATNLRQRVRSYFSTDERRKVESLLRATARIDHKVTTTVLEAEILELRLIRRLRPRFNSAHRNAARQAYLRLSLSERFPRLALAYRSDRPGDLLVGPAPRAVVGAAVDAVQSVVPLRRCTRVARAGDHSPCLAAQMGRALCPCRGDVSPESYSAVAATARAALTDRPELVVDPLVERMRSFAAEERFERAEATRCQLAAFVALLDRSRRIERWRGVEAMLRLDSGEAMEVSDGRLIRVWAATDAWTPRGQYRLDLGTEVEATPPPPGPLPFTPDLAAEALHIDRWVSARAGSLRVEPRQGTVASVWPGVDVSAAEPRAMRRAARRSA